MRWRYAPLHRNDFSPLSRSVEAVCFNRIPSCRRMHMTVFGSSQIRIAAVHPSTPADGSVAAYAPRAAYATARKGDADSTQSRPCGRFFRVFSQRRSIEAEDLAHIREEERQFELQKIARSCESLSSFPTGPGHVQDAARSCRTPCIRTINEGRHRRRPKGHRKRARFASPDMANGLADSPAAPVRSTEHTRHAAQCVPGQS